MGHVNVKESFLGKAVRFYGSLVVMGGIFLSLDIGSWVIRRCWTEGERRQQIGRRWLHLLSRFSVWYLHKAGILACDAQALHALRGKKSVILIANHPSRLDSLILASLLPRVVCVTKASIWERPILGSTLQTAGYIRHDTLLRVLAPASAHLKAGGQVLLFPEGTRAHAGASPNPLQTGFAAIAQCTGAPIQVVLIETTNPYLSQGWRYYKIPPLPIAYRISLGPIFSAPRDEASARALVEQVEICFKKAFMKNEMVHDDA